MPTAAAPPSRKATTAIAIPKAASAVQLAPKASCERRREELPAATVNGRAEEASRLRAHPRAGASITALIASSRTGAPPHEQQITTR
jgi:hypothetical protein